MTALPERGARCVRVGGVAIAVFRTSTGEVFALRDQCPHRGGPLSQGIVHGTRVTCPLHDWVIDLEDGPGDGRRRRLDGDVQRARRRWPHRARAAGGGARESLMSAVRTTCPYCGVGCGLLARRDAADGGYEIRGDPEHPANLGRVCSKGAALGDTLGLEGRLLHPEVDGARASWDEALDAVARASHARSRRTARAPSRSTCRASC